MPRFSAEQRLKLKEELLEDDDDDDDDILKPSLLHPSNKNISQMSPQTNPQNEEKRVEEVEETISEKEIEEQAMKNAQIAIERILSIKCFPKIEKATDLKWLRIGQQIWPVFVNHDPSNARLVDIKQGNKLIIEYIGNRMIHKSTIQAAFARSLSDFHSGDDERSWSPDKMASYMKQLKRYKPFADMKKHEQQRMIMEEQFFLELLLKKQLQLDESVVETNGNTRDEDDEEEEEVEREETVKYTASEETVTVTPPSPPSTPGSHHRIVTDAEMNAQCRKLRAGDVIEYVHPVFPSRRLRAMILKVMPPSASRKNDNDIVLSLSDGMVLQRETEVRLVKRFLRGTLVDNPGAVTMFLWDFKLDASQNGKFKESDYNGSGAGKSMAENMQAAYDEANKQVEQDLMKLANRGLDDNVETDLKLPHDRKRKWREGHTSSDQETRHQQTSSRRRL